MDDMIRFCRNIDEYDNDDDDDENDDDNNDDDDNDKDEDDDNDNGNNDDERSDILVLDGVFVNIVEFITVVGVMDRFMKEGTLNAMVLLVVLCLYVEVRLSIL